MSAQVGLLDLVFEAPIGLMVKGDRWSCVEVPDSVKFFGTGKSVKVRATVDGAEVVQGLMPTGAGGHMLSISAKLRTTIGKQMGDPVEVHLVERLS